jgi:hypothetical protein
VDWLGSLWGDLPTRVATAGLAVFLAVSGGLLRWISQHYLRSAATGWGLTTWEKAEAAADQLARQEVT